MEPKFGGVHMRNEVFISIQRCSHSATGFQWVGQFEQSGWDIPRLGVLPR